MNSKLILAILLCAIIGVVAASVSKQYFYPTNGTIQTVGVSVTWASNSTVITNLNWGNVKNNSNYLMDPIKITNTGQTNVTLSLSTAYPSTSIIALTLTWNYTGAIIQPSQYVVVELTQNITAIGPWSYTTIITATEMS